MTETALRLNETSSTLKKVAERSKQMCDMDIYMAPKAEQTLHILGLVCCG